MLWSSVCLFVITVIVNLVAGPVCPAAWYRGEGRHCGTDGDQLRDTSVRSTLSLCRTECVGPRLQYHINTTINIINTMQCNLTISQSTKQSKHLGLNYELYMTIKDQLGSPEWLLIDNFVTTPPTSTDLSPSPPILLTFTHSWLSQIVTVTKCGS